MKINHPKIEHYANKAKNLLKQRYHVTAAVNAKIDRAVFLWFFQERQTGVLNR